MNPKYEVWMNGVPLSSLSPSVYISSIICKPAAITVNTARTAGRDGERPESLYRNGTSVQVGFYLKKTDNVFRQELMDAVKAWAREGILQVSDMPYKRLRVRCIEYPYVPDTCDWSTQISMKFQAYEQPFWEECQETSLTLTGSSGSGVLYVPGNAGKTLVEVTAVPTGSLENISLTVGSTGIALTGVSATSAAPVTISYDENGIQRIQCGNTSILSKRTGSDDLEAECGTRTAVSFSASAAVNVTFRARGLWL